jgi:voltage-gated sodium channel
MGHGGAAGTAGARDAMFQMLTLEGWVKIQAAVLDTYPWAWLYFSSFVLVAVFVVVNLFIAVVINNLESVKHEQQAEADRASSNHELLSAITALQQRLADLENRLRASPVDSARDGR